MDFGARLSGYHADMTRTVILGTPDEQFERVYTLVRSAQQHAAHQVRAGMSGRAADALARDMIAEAGYGDNFGHSLGHGVGLAIHEAPWLRAAGDEPLPTGAVCSIEPGIYLPGWGGIRVEDLVALTDTGARTLTQSSKEPVIALD
jgi:Xaa-Pro aminopeptidase